MLDRHRVPGVHGRIPVRRRCRDWDSVIPTQDTDTNDPNAVDIISGPAAQSTVLDWTAHAPVVAPYVPITP